MQFPLASNVPFITHRERLRLAALRVALDKALSADQPPDLTPFVQRDSYSVALAYCVRQWKIGNFGPAPILHQAGPFLAYRIAIHFGALRVTKRSARDRRLSPFTLEDLRALDSHEAKLALACLGECNYCTAPRDVRAGWLYGEIVRRGVKS